MDHKSPLGVPRKTWTPSSRTPLHRTTSRLAARPSSPKTSSSPENLSETILDDEKKSSKEVSCDCLIPDSCHSNMPPMLMRKFNETTETIENLFDNVTKFIDKKLDQNQLKALEKLSASERAIQLHPETRVFRLNDEVFKNLSESQPEQFVLTLPDGSQAGLVRINIFTKDFKIVTASGEHIDKIDYGLHYQGTLLDNSQKSIVAISFYPQTKEIAGILSSEKKGNISLGRIGRETKESSIQPEDIFYVDNSKELTNIDEENGPSKWRCDNIQQDSLNSLVPAQELKGLDEKEFREAQSSKIIQLYVETDYDIYVSLGSTQAITNYINSIFNSVIRIYNNEGIPVQIHQLFIWDKPSPFVGKDSGTLLNQFVTHRNTFDGDFGILLAFRGNGGLANSLNGWATRDKSDRSPSQCFAGINPYYKDYPAYSWSVDCVAHELGHLCQMMHCHHCGFNGNNTAIDGCAGYVEGNCPMPPTPDSRYTFIMSYCHLTSVGKNLTNGFGQQHGNVLRSFFTKYSSSLQKGNFGPFVIPVISFKPEYLYFTASQGRKQIATQTIQIVNGAQNQEELIWHASTEVSWIKLTSTTGTTPSKLGISIDVSSIAPGNYRERVWFNASGAIQQTLILFITVLPGKKLPTINVTPNALLFEGNIRDTLPSQNIIVTNSGNGILYYSVNEDIPWLTVTPKQGNLKEQESETLTVTVNTLSCAVGENLEEIIIHAPGATNSPQEVVVSVLLAAHQPTIQLSHSQLSFYGPSQDNIPTQTFIVTNQGNASLNFTISDSTTWLETSPSAGSLLPEGKTNIVVAVNSDSLPSGHYSGLIHINDPNATVPTETINVHLDIGESDAPSSFLTLTPKSLEFTGEIGTKIKSQELVLQNSGTQEMVLSWKLSSEETKWIKFIPIDNLQSNECKTMIVDIVTDHLTPGIYQDFLILESVTATNCPLKISIRLVLTEKPVCVNGNIHSVWINKKLESAHLPTYRVSTPGRHEATFVSPLDAKDKYTLSLSRFDFKTRLWHIVSEGVSIEYDGDVSDYYLTVNSKGAIGIVTVCYKSPPRIVWQANLKEDKSSPYEVLRKLRDEDIQLVEDASSPQFHKHHLASPISSLEKAELKVEREKLETKIVRTSENEVILKNNMETIIEEEEKLLQPLCAKKPKMQIEKETPNLNLDNTLHSTTSVDLCNQALLLDKEISQMFSTDKEIALARIRLMIELLRSNRSISCYEKEEHRD